MYDFIVQMKKRNFKVCLISLALPDERLELEDVRALCDEARFLVSRPIFSGGIFNSAKNPFSFVFKLMKTGFKFFEIRRWFKRNLDELLRLQDPDVIQVEYSVMSLYLPRIKSKKMKILHLYDVMLKPAQRVYLNEKNSFRRLLFFIFFLVTKHIELGFCRQFDRLLVKAEFD